MTRPVNKSREAQDIEAARRRLRSAAHLTPLAKKPMGPVLPPVQQPGSNVRDKQK